MAWRFNSGDLPQLGENAHGHEFNFAATPIKIDDTTYFCTPHRDIVALDARTGTICSSFGQNGYVDLRQGMGNVPPGFHFISSQPLVVRGKIMLSGWIYDNQTVGEPSGVIRAFDATTGQLA